MSEKGKQIISYVFGWLGGLIVLFGLKDNTKKTNFHAAQAIVLSAGYFIIIAVYNMLPIWIPFLSTALWICYIVFIVMGIIKISNDEKPELPVVGDLAKKIFEKQINTGLDFEVNKNQTNNNQNMNVNNQPTDNNQNMNSNNQQ